MSLAPGNGVPPGELVSFLIVQTGMHAVYQDIYNCSQVHMRTGVLVVFNTNGDFRLKFYNDNDMFIVSLLTQKLD
jgi:hypothetical protein